jgi:predicted Zn-ribbon and HTH transcriptional regulator
MIKDLIEEYKAIPGKRFAYNSRTNTITYNPRELGTPRGAIALLHEIAHCKLGHFSYQYDRELIGMEEEAWAETRKDAKKHGIPVDEEHISYCLQTYREWAQKRSTCPACTYTFGEQRGSVLFACPECKAEWEVNRRKDRRVMRRLIKNPSR